MFALPSPLSRQLTRYPLPRKSHRGIRGIDRGRGKVQPSRGANYYHHERDRTTSQSYDVTACSNIYFPASHAALSNLPTRELPDVSPDTCCRAHQRQISPPPPPLRQQRNPPTGAHLDPLRSNDSEGPDCCAYPVFYRNLQSIKRLLSYV